MTSDCGHKLTPDFHVSQRATQSCQPWVEGSHQRVLIRPPSNARWQGHAPVRMGRANQETMRQAEKERMGRRKKKSPPAPSHFLALCGLTSDPCPVALSWLQGSARGQAAWDLRPVCLCGSQSLKQEVKALLWKPPTSVTTRRRNRIRIVLPWNRKYLTLTLCTFELKS